MKYLLTCIRTVQAAVLAVCAFLCLSSAAHAQVVTLPLDLQCPTNVVLWTCSGEVQWQSPLPVPSGGCSNYTVVCDPPVGTVLTVGAHDINCRVVDKCQKVENCKFTIVVRRDTEPPVIRCPSNFVAQICPDAAGACFGVVNYPSPTASDNSGSVSVICNPPSGSVFPCGTNVVTCAAFDACQNRATCQFTVAVQTGGVAPSIRCPQDQVILTCSNAAVVVYPAPQVLPTTATVFCTPPSGSVLPIGGHAVVCVASNACGVSRCEFKVEVRPVAPPTITCPPDVSIVLPCGSNCIQVAYAPPTVDNGVLAGCTPPPGACLTPGVTTVTCAATNRCGDRAVCQFQVRVVQGQGNPPQITCPADLTVTTCSNCQVVAYAAPVVNNGVLVRCNPPSGSCFPLGDTTVVCGASNACARAECSFTISVRPVAPPQIVCPTNVVVLTAPCGTNCAPAVYPAPSVVNGALAGCTPPPGTCLPVGLQTVTCIATNRCGERDVCQFQVRVIQEQGNPPQISCPANLTVNTCSNCQVVTYAAPIVGNGALIKCIPPSGSCFPLGDTVVVCEASNACSRTECSFKITLRPVLPPQIVCPTNTIVLTVPCGSNCVPATYSLPTVVNGTLVGCTPPPGTCLPVGLHTVTCRATNSCGERVGCEFVIRVVAGPDAPPALECPRDLTVTACSNTCQVVTYAPPVVVNGVVVGCQPPSGSCFPPGVTTVTCLASNACGRSECKFTITVRPLDSCVKPPLNMVLWLPFDEPAGVLAHNIVAGAPNGIHVNGPVPLLGQHVLNSLAFDGINDFVRVPNYAAIQLSQSDLTIDAWVLRRAGPAGQGREVLVSKMGNVFGAAGNRGYEFYLNNGVMNLALGGVAAQNYNSGTLVPLDNQWHHVAVTVRRSAGGNVRFYLDGAGVASLAGPIPAPLANSWPLYVGAGTFPVPHGFFRGAIDEVEIFNRALTPVEIASLWNANRAGKCKIKCSIPWDVAYPSNQQCITVLARIWNCSAVPQAVQWTATGPMPIPTPTGSLIIPPFTCTNVPVVLCRPTNGLPVGSVVRWNFTVDTATQCPIVCVGSVINPGPIVVTVPVLPIAIPGTSRVQVVRVGLNGLPPGTVTPLRLRVVGPDMTPDTFFVSLNGLPPGQPWIRGGGAAGGEGGNGGGFEVPVRFVNSDPIGLYTILIEADVDGDGAYDTVASFDVENPVVAPPTLELVNRDGRYLLFWEDGGDGYGVLETAKEVDGPWEQLPNAEPGYPVNPSQRTQYFRVVMP